MCGGGSDELNIIDITDLSAPELIKSYNMWGPYGLGIDGTTLFICDGEAGLKIYDATDDMNLELLEWFQDVETYDVIPLGGTAIVVGSGGLHLYDYTDPGDIRKRGTIVVGE